MPLADLLRKILSDIGYATYIKRWLGGGRAALG